ncbi:MAG TPA: S8 family serine peptidase, partial [Pilimelia sp.]|nr:S8 family serine peptidase [Pilimelia sp.]
MAAAAVVVLSFGSLGAGPGPAQAAPADPDRRAGASKVAQKVRDLLAEKGSADFWVMLADEADLRAASARRDRAARAAAVRQSAIRHAATSQAGLRRLLTDRKAPFTPYWIVNALRVTGDAALLNDVAARPEVARVVADEPVRLPRPLPGRTRQAAAGGAEWNVARIRAPQVWNQLGVRGEGVVVANIDTGVQYDHPALASSYRGRRADGTVDHDYNWFDPSGICPSPAPCDNDGHGTHTMGTMVGSHGGDEIGVAPRATWMAVKGCEYGSCSLSALLAAGQWILAPTDLAGRNPRPDLAPD